MNSKPELIVGKVVIESVAPNRHDEAFTVIGDDNRAPLFTARVTVHLDFAGAPSQEDALALVGKRFVLKEKR